MNLSTHNLSYPALAVGLAALLPLVNASEVPLVDSASPLALTADDLPISGGTALLLLDGQPIDVLEGAGHAGPLVLDLDGEAPADLLVGDLHGSLHSYLGRNTDDGIRYESNGKLQSNGKDIRVHNW